MGNFHDHTKNINDLTGLLMNIKKTPTAPPIKLPKIGINAVNPIITLIGAAYGSLNINIPIKHNIPNIQASVTWTLT